MEYALALFMISRPTLGCRHGGKLLAQNATMTSFYVPVLYRSRKRHNVFVFIITPSTGTVQNFSTDEVYLLLQVLQNLQKQ